MLIDVTLPCGGLKISRPYLFQASDLGCTDIATSSREFEVDSAIVVAEERWVISRFLIARISSDCPMPPVESTWQVLCHNLTMLHRSISETTNPDVVSNTTGGPEVKVNDEDRHAVLYIVVVLLFYSLGIVIAIVMYLKREKEEIEEDVAYDDYMNFRSDPDKWARYFRVQRMISHMNTLEKSKTKREKETELESACRAITPDLVERQVKEVSSDEVLELQEGDVYEMDTYSVGEVFEEPDTPCTSSSEHIRAPDMTSP